MSSLSAGLLTKSEEELLQIALGSGGSGSSGGQNQQQKSGYSFQNSSGGDVLKHSGNPGGNF
jgi:hypothetical protein